MTYYHQQVLRLQAFLYPHAQVCTQMQRAKQVMDHAFAEPLTLPHVAAVAGCSQFHFLRQFKRYYGRTPHQYLREVRMRQAQLALTAGLSVTDACFAVGFTSVSSFSGLFRQWTGYSPGVFAKQQAGRL
ncbi:helix-turn-helix transcriptional regulator [Hymenobacter sp. GOD-10R]|uniref:helix-turn-helix transcriptional regulator n=1 Tax=Hymenobacter sp. GOD-10R TaxID=3093922 RepID=UPI002D792826|nr:helix-turn-helix transcriptional regulator [Hymenobacter sp. GOD-10R]WRQ31734.1 helix-turn-helix transcriptional regulator [Hymenobacter sp. GOD-10R]